MWHPCTQMNARHPCTRDSHYRLPRLLTTPLARARTPAEGGDMKRVRAGEEGMVVGSKGDVRMLFSQGSHGAGEDRPLQRVFECKTCNRTFPTFQALGGHRTSHRKPKLRSGEGLDEPRGDGGCAKPKMHECSVCGLEFAIGQALGGHMRRHKGESDRVVVSSHPGSTQKGSLLAAGLWCLDLNLPPMEDDVGFLTLATSGA